MIAVHAFPARSLWRALAPAYILTQLNREGGQGVVRGVSFGLPLLQRFSYGSTLAGYGNFSPIPTFPHAGGKGI